MNIAISGDCFSSFTSGFPVRGMIMELIKNSPEHNFVIFYTKRPFPTALNTFYSELHQLPNVSIEYFKYSRKVIFFKRLFFLKYLNLDNSFDCFINPGNLEFIRGFKGKQICSLADLSTIRGYNTGRYSLLFKYLNRILFRVLLTRIDTIVPISEYTKRDLVEFYPKIESKLRVVYNGIDSFWFDDKYKDISHLNVPNEYFIWWGLVSRRKNLEVLIKAYIEARKKIKPLPALLIVGGISAHMSHIMEYFTPDNNIYYLPFQEDYILKSLVANSKGLFFPSFYEGFGLPLIEAYSQGISVACSNITSLPEIAGKEAVLFDPYKIETVIEAIETLSIKTPDPNLLKIKAGFYTYSRASEEYKKILMDL